MSVAALPSKMSDLPNGVCYLIEWFASIRDLEALRLVSPKWRHLAEHDALWQSAATKRWGESGRRMTTAQPLAERLIAEGEPWRSIYWAVEADGSRCAITKDEIVRLSWAFSDAVQLCDFRADGTLHMTGVGGPSGLPWSIDEEGQLIVAHFPPHTVERLPNWGWVMKNQFIFIIEAAAVGTSTSSSASAENMETVTIEPSAVRALFDAACRGAGARAAPLETEDTSTTAGRATSVLNLILGRLLAAREGRGMLPVMARDELRARMAPPAPVPQEGGGGEAPGAEAQGDAEDGAESDAP